MNRLKLLRMMKGQTQVQLMRATGINHSQISRIEGGWIRPTNEQQNKLATALDVDRAWLFPQRKKEDDYN